jgi:hypothetical protein
VPGLAGVRQLATGAMHSCALLESGAVRCWGMNDHGQLGAGDVADRWTPTEVVLGGRAAQIAAAGKLTCALLEDGALRCWGENAYGQVGDGSRVDRATPTPVRWSRPQGTPRR